MQRLIFVMKQNIKKKVFKTQLFSTLKITRKVNS